MKPGDVIVIYNEDIYPPKKKLSLCLSLKDNLFFLINSQSNYPFSLAIDKENHKFLKRDSYICCGRIFSYPKEKIEKVLKDKSLTVGKLVADKVIELINYLSNVKTLNKEEKNIIMNSFKTSNIL